MEEAVPFELVVFVVPLAVLAASLLSGVLGMAGGVVLMVVLWLMLPVSSAMILHGIAQLSSSGFRVIFFFRHTCWKGMLAYLAGLLVALAIVSVVAYIPDKRVLFLLLGGLSVSALIMPRSSLLDFAKPLSAFFCGIAVNIPTFIVGVSGGIFDLFFVKTELNRYQVMASKAVAMTFSQIVKIFYFLNLFYQAAESSVSLFALTPAVVISSLVGTYAGRQILDRISECRFRSLGRAVILGLGLVLLGRGMLAVLI